MLINIKIFFLVIILSTNNLVVFSQSDTSKIKSKFSPDTTFIKIIENKKTDKGLESILPYIIGGMITGTFTLLGVYLTLRHQRIVIQKQIDVETKRKLIGDLMEVIKKVNLTIFETFDVSHEILENIPNEAITIESLDEGKGKIDLAMKKMDDKLLELMYWSGTVLLYIPKTHLEYDKLKNLSAKLSRSYSNYHLYFNGSEIPIIEKEKKLGDILQKRVSYYSDKIEYIIDAERENINNILR